MTVFHFTIEVDGINADAPGFENQLCGSGVDDASICVTRGKVFLGFDREASNKEAALESAIRDVTERGGRVVNVAMDDLSD